MKKIEVTVNGSSKIKGFTFKTYRIDLQPFLFTFKSQLINKGVKFVEKKLNFDNLFELKESIIFNCTALGSRALFG